MLERCTADDLNSTPRKRGHYCKRCIDGRPAFKATASCGCTVLFCSSCVEKVTTVDHTDRDIRWWIGQYGKSHERQNRECALRGRETDPND